jgi:hypothetical protein
LFRLAFLIAFGAPICIYLVLWPEHDPLLTAGLVVHAVFGAIVYIVVSRYRLVHPAKQLVLPVDNTAARSDSDEAVLSALGISTGDGELKAACARIARRLHAEKIRVVGFVPSDPIVAVPPVIVQLGLALTELTGATVAVVDANVRYPGLTLAQGAATDSDGSVFSTRWLHGSLALLSPPRLERAGEVVPQLARVLLDGSDLFAHVLVDLTGFELLGEHGSAAACMDAVALVGRAHYTKEHELLQLAPLMPQNRFLGVLLVG